MQNKFYGKKILITGGASGIGKIMARTLLEKGATVMIWDINPEHIADTLSAFSNHHNAAAYVVNVANAEGVLAAAKKVNQDYGVVDMIINNAGIIVGKYFSEHSIADINSTMDINTKGPMLVTLAFLPDMITQNAGHICNIASSGGLLSNPKMSVYAASKWALIGWSDSLRLEMKQLNKNIQVTTVLPYYINTGMFAGVASKIPILEPEAAASSIIKAIEKNRKIISIPGYIYRFTRFGQALLSTNGFDWFAGSFLGIYKTMAHFTGRKK